MTTCRALAAVLMLAAPALAGAQRAEGLWYARNDPDGIRSFVEHADRISVVSPQVFAMDSTGVIRGGIDARIVAAARAHGVKLVPLVMNPGFSLEALHRILTVTGARATAVRSLAALCRNQRLDGVQLDFENLHVSDREAFTAFAREAVDSVHRAGCSLSLRPWYPAPTTTAAHSRITSGCTTTGAARTTTRRWPTRSTSSRT